MRRLRTFGYRESTAWCGPAALMSVTGCDAHRADTLIRKARREIWEIYKAKGYYCPRKPREKIGRVGHDELTRAVGMLTTARWERLHPPDRPRLRKWFRERPSRGVCIVNVTGHYIAVCGERWTDNTCHSGTWPLALSAYLNSTVCGVIWVG